MLNKWQGCKNILCIRPDNMGDLIMTGPALQALKTTFGARITVLISSMAADIAKLMPVIDEVIVADLPWVKTPLAVDIAFFNPLVEKLKKIGFDAAVIFTVYSQNPLPTVMLAYLAGIPLRLSNCRENPYQLLTDWMPDREPYELIKHQVNRDLDLVASVGATSAEDKLYLDADDILQSYLFEKLAKIGCDLTKPWLILHPGVSELKRRYLSEKWIAVGRKLVESDFQLLITGSKSEKELTKQIQQGIGKGSVDTGGSFAVSELVTLIKAATAIVSVNTGTVHIAAAVQTPVVVLYALTNPQHTPWKVEHRVLPFTPVAAEQSKNEVIRFVNQRLYSDTIALPDENEVLTAVQELLALNKAEAVDATA